MGEAHYAQIAPHLYGGPDRGVRRNIQLDVCSPKFLDSGRYPTHGTAFHADILKEPLQWEDGYIIPSNEARPRC